MNNRQKVDEKDKDKDKGKEDKKKDVKGLDFSSVVEKIEVKAG